MRNGTCDFKSERHALDYYRKQDGECTINDVRAKVAEGEIRIGYPKDLKAGLIFQWDADGRGEITERPFSETVFGLKAIPRPYQCQLAECLHIHNVGTNHTGPISSICPKCHWHGGFDTAGHLYRSDTGKYRPHIYVGPAPTEADFNPHLKRAPRDE